MAEKRALSDTRFLAISVPILTFVAARKGGAETGMAGFLEESLRDSSHGLKCGPSAAGKEEI